MVITGANDAPVITSTPFVNPFTEANDTGNSFNRYNEQGTIQFTDVDITQLVSSFSVTGVTAGRRRLHHALRRRDAFERDLAQLLLGRHAAACDHP